MRREASWNRGSLGLDVQNVVIGIKPVATRHVLVLHAQAGKQAMAMCGMNVENSADAASVWSWNTAQTCMQASCPLH